MDIGTSSVLPAPPSLRRANVESLHLGQCGVSNVYVISIYELHAIMAKPKTIAATVDSPSILPSFFLLSW